MHRWLQALLAATLAGAALTPARARADLVTSLQLHSAPGDYIGQGGDYYADASRGGSFSVQTFARGGDGRVNVLEFTVSGPMPDFPGLYADLFFATDRIAGNYLAPGTYQAERYPFEHTGEGGLDVGMDFRGSNMLYGSFTILDAQIDYSGGAPRVVSFAATFVQHSEQPDAPPLTGTLYYNYEVSAVPAPGGLALAFPAGLALAGYGWARRRRALPAGA
jgi:hypothetical protein